MQVKRMLLTDCSRVRSFRYILHLRNHLWALRQQARTSFVLWQVAFCTHWGLWADHQHLPCIPTEEQRPGPSSLQTGAAQASIRPDRVLQEPGQQQPSTSTCVLTLWSCEACEGSQCTGCTVTCARTAAEASAIESASRPPPSRGWLIFWWVWVAVACIAFLILIGVACHDCHRTKAAERQRIQEAAARRQVPRPAAHMRNQGGAAAGNNNAPAPAAAPARNQARVNPCVAAAPVLLDQAAAGPQPAPLAAERAMGMNNVD